MSTMDNSKKIIEMIKDQDITPTPKWIYSSKNIALWLGYIVAVILGGLAFSVILFVIQQTDFNVINHMSHSRMELFLGLLPMIWLIMVLVFLGMAILSIRNSWKGYKFSVLKLVSICVAMSVTLGTLFFIAGGGQKLEHAFDVNIFSYESIEDRKQKIWSNPQEGYLSGSIISVNENVIEIRDFQKVIWQVYIDNAFIAPPVMLENEEKIKIVGERKNASEFIAMEVRPWGGLGNRLNIGRKGNNINNQ